MPTTFSERLGPLRARLGTAHTAVRPVSRVSFEISDKIAFAKCIELSVKWMSSRVQAALPVEAWSGASFDMTEVLGANPARAIRIEASDGSLWAARLDWPDPSIPRTWVSELFAEHRAGEMTRFGAQLTCVVRGNSPPYDTTRPTVVRHILETLSAECDGWPLTDHAKALSEAELSEFVALLYDPNRRLPVVAISGSDDGTNKVGPDDIARHIGGAAHVVYIPAETTWGLTKLIGKRMSVFNGAVRLYTPGLTEENEDAFQHPLWMQPSIRDDFVKTMAARVLPMGFLRNPEGDEFPRYATLRDIAVTYARSKQPTNNSNVQLATDLENVKLRYQEATEERDFWQSLAQDEQSQRLEAEASVERLQEELRRLESKAGALEYKLNASPTAPMIATQVDRPLESYDDLEDWADETLGVHIYIHQAALKDCKKNGHASMLDRIQRALLTIRDFVVPALIHGGLERVSLARERLGELGMVDTACFVNRDEAKRTPGYTVPYDGRSVVLSDHIKYGNGYDNANQIRIYYSWDDVRQRFVIGKMPSHLRNNLTN